MKWMRERDALIAQTLAFVQSVTGRRDAGVPLPPVVPELPPAPPPAAIPSPVVPGTVETPSSLATSGPTTNGFATNGFATNGLATNGLAANGLAANGLATKSQEKSTEPVSPSPSPRPLVPSDFQRELKARIESFRAHQERFNREREEYFSATLARLRAAIKDGPPPAARG